MEWILVAVIAILVIRDVIREEQWYSKEIDLVDRALPRTDGEHKNSSFSHKIKGLSDKPKRSRRGKGDAERVDADDKTADTTKRW